MSGLEHLAYFLNYDFKSKDVEEMTGREPLDPVEGLLYRHRLVSREGLKAAWDLHQELAGDLLGLVKVAKGWGILIQHPHLTMAGLIHKINRLKISPIYTFEFGTVIKRVVTKSAIALL